MTVDISWLFEGHVILAKGAGDLDLQQLEAADAVMVEMIRSKLAAVPMVHILVDLRATTKMQVGVHELSQALTHLREPYIGWTLLVTANRLIRFAGSIANQVAKARFRAFTDFDEAYAFLMEQDQTVPPLENAS